MPRDVEVFSAAYSGQGDSGMAPKIRAHSYSRDPQLSSLRTVMARAAAAAAVCKRAIPVSLAEYPDSGPTSHAGTVGC
jgi:hypothetical protein